MSQRVRYQQMFAKGKILNVGCSGAPIDLGEDVTHVDIDLFDMPNFIQADAHDLHMFKDKEFDTVILGDVLEHSPEPVKMLKECMRVGKKLVATIWEETRNEGMTVLEKIDKGNSDIKDMGFDKFEDYHNSCEVHGQKIIKATSDHELPHHFHIQNFTDESIGRIIDECDLNIRIFTKYKESEFEGQTFYNWLLVAEGK